MHNYEYDVFMSFTGRDRELKDAVRRHLESPEVGLRCYDSDRDCQGDFRDNYCEGIDKSRVYLLILTDSLRNDPLQTGEGSLTEVRKEVNLAMELEAQNQLNVVILCMSEFFSYRAPFHDYEDRIGWFFYSHTRGFSQIFARVDEDGSLSEKTLNDIAAQSLHFITKRNEGNPVPSQAPHFEIAIERLTERDIFKGRATEIEEVLRAFGDGKQVVVLSGLGGIGKTTLAAEIMRRSEDMKFLQCPQMVHIQEMSGGDGIHTIVSAATYEKSVYNDLPRLSEAEKHARKLRALAELPETVLLVVDNMNTLCRDDIGEIVKNLKCRVLITTRVNLDNTSENVKVLAIGCLGREEAHEMFCEISGQNVPEDLFDNLYRFAGGHTITLCIMAKMMAVHGMTVEELLSEMGELDSFDARVDFRHNEYGDADTVLGHLNKLFDISDFDEGCCRILRAMSILSDGIISVRDLQSVLGLRNRNEINLLVSGGWLELRRREETHGVTEELYLHPILSRLMAKRLVPTEENVGEMIGYLIKVTEDSRVRMTYNDATLLADRLYYACYVLAGDSHQLSRALWKCFTQVNHMLGDVEETSKKTNALAARVADDADRSAVTAYGDMILLEQNPMRVDLLEKYVGRLALNSHDYKWVSSQLSVTISYILGVPKYRDATARLLDQALSEAMAQEDDIGVLALISYCLVIGKHGKAYMHRLKTYIKTRKKKAGGLPILIYLEYILNSVSVISYDDMDKDLSRLISMATGDDEKGAFLLMLRHPLSILKNILLMKKIRKLEDGEDSITYILKIVGKMTDEVQTEGTWNAGELLSASYELYTLFRSHKMTLQSASDAIRGAIAVLDRFPDSFVRREHLLKATNIDPDDMSIEAISMQQVNMIINKQYGNKDALDQARYLMETMRALRPRGHADVISSTMEYADICAMFGQQTEAIMEYYQLYAQLSRSAPESAMLAKVATRLLGQKLPVKSTSVEMLKQLRETALLDEPDNQAGYYVVWTYYAYRLMEQLDAGNIEIDGGEFGELWEMLNVFMKKRRRMLFTAQNTVLQLLRYLGECMAYREKPQHMKAILRMLNLFCKSRKKVLAIDAEIYRTAIYSLCAWKAKDTESLIKYCRLGIRQCIKSKTNQYKASEMAERLLNVLMDREEPIYTGLGIRSQKKIEQYKGNEERFKTFLYESCERLNIVRRKNGHKGKVFHVPEEERDAWRESATVVIMRRDVQKLAKEMFHIPVSAYRKLGSEEKFYQAALDSLYLQMYKEYMSAFPVGCPCGSGKPFRLCCKNK